MQDNNIDNIKLNCFDQKSKNSKKIIIIVVLSISGIAVISLITVCICCCKNKKEEQIPETITIRPFNSQRNSFNNYYSASNRRIKFVKI